MTSETSATGRRTVYTGRTTNWPMVALTTALAVLLIVMGTTTEGGWGSGSGAAVVLALFAIGILGNVLTASSVRASAGPKGFDIRWGLVGWPRCTYLLDDIATAEVFDLPFHRVSFGFWWTPKRTNCTIRSGPTVRLVLTDGRIVTVTVPDPELAVRALDDART